MKTKLLTSSLAVLTLVTFNTKPIQAAKPRTASQAQLTEVGEKLKARYEGQLQQLRTKLMPLVPEGDKATRDQIDKLVSSNALDESLVKLAVLTEATPHGLAEFSQQDKDKALLVEKLLSDTRLMKRMLIADGASAPKQGKSLARPSMALRFRFIETFAALAPSLIQVCSAGSLLR